MSTQSATSDTLSDPSPHDVVEFHSAQSCEELLAKLAAITEPFSYYAAWIPGERTRSADFWIRINGNRFEVWPKARTAAWVTTSRRSGYYRVCVRGEIIPVPDGCVLRTRLDEGKLLANYWVTRWILIAFFILVLITEAAALLLDGISIKFLTSLAVVLVFFFLMWLVFRHAKVEYRRAIENDKRLLHRFILMLANITDTSNTTETEIVSQQAVNRTDLSS